MRRNLSSIIVVLATAAAIGACGTDTIAPFDGEPAFNKGGPKQPAPSYAWTIPSSGFGLRNDGGGDYVNGHCSVTTALYDGNLNIQMDAPKRNGCSRTVTVNYGSGTPVQETLRVFMSGRSFGTVADNTTALRTFAINPNFVNQPSRCGRLLFGTGDNGAGAGSDQVSVTRNGNEWHVRSQDDGNGGKLTKVWCENEPDNWLNIEVDFRITLK
ncbi:hypothetical protein BH23GEM9_BH23GEM9_15750 [soil metagenome]